jgi:hypothetical protein
VETNATNAKHAAAADEFIGACAAVRRAWHRTNLLSMSNPLRITAVREVLRAGDSDRIVELMGELSGPAATPSLKDAFGLAAHRHVALAGQVGRLAVKRALRHRAAGAMVDLTLVSAVLVEWIATGKFDGSRADSEVEQAGRISDLLEATSDNVDIARLRLAVVAPLAAPLESLSVLAALSDELVAVMRNGATARSAEHVAHGASDAEATTEPEEQLEPGSTDATHSVTARVADGEPLGSKAAGPIKRLWRALVGARVRRGRQG